MVAEIPYPYLKRSQFVCLQCKGEDGRGAFFFFALAADIREKAAPDGKGDLEFVASCPQCGAECEELWYCANLRRAAGKQTGPTSEAGKNKIRMNGYRTGSRYLTGKIPKYLPPAKPEAYAECDECQDKDECKAAVAEAMGTCRFVACHRQSEVFAKYRNAHLTGDTGALQLTAADNQARMQLVLNALFKAIFKHGVLIDSVVVNKDGVVYIDTNKTDSAGEKISVPLTELKGNPATNDMVKLAEKMGFSLADWTLTPKSKEAKAVLEGYLAGQAAAKGQTMDEFITQYNDDVKKFHCALERGNIAAQNDETLKEALAEERGGGDA